MNINYNNVSGDYIGATGIYSISDYIDNTSNVIESHLLVTSNILNTNSSNYTSNTSNYIVNRYDQLIKKQVEHITFPIETDLYHTYIFNSNIAGEIRFWCESASDYPVINPIGVPDYRVRIEPNGHLSCYYTYDPLISLTFGNGWIDVANSIVNLNSADANFVISLSGLEAQIINNYNLLQSQIAALIFALEDYTLMTESQRILVQQRVTEQAGFVRAGQQSMTNAIASIREATLTGLPQYFTNGLNIITAIITNNPLTASFLGASGAAFVFVANKIFEQEYYNVTLGFMTSNVKVMTGITETRRQELYTDLFNERIKVLANITENEYNTGLAQGFINSNVSIQQTIKNLKCDILNLNTGNIENINGISANELIANGKIKQNGILLDNTYLTSNALYNLTYNYTSERQYPSKAFTTASIEDTVTLLGGLVYHQILYLDTSSISYGSGFYEIYSSSTYDINTSKSKLFNYNTVESSYPRWGISLYNSGTGNYQGSSTIDNNYYGDWVIIKLQKPILLTRYMIYQRNENGFREKAPSEWKVYGSNDGITFTEIIQASQMIRLISTDYTYGYYEKTLNPSFITQYQYIGFVFGKLLSVSGQTDLSFAELKLFGKEIINNSIASHKYTTPDAVKNIVEFDMNIVAKHYGFYISINTPIVIGTTTYYKYDIDLRQYTKLGVIQIGPQSGDTFRSFKIRIMLGTMFFSYIINDLPNVCYYEVFMSYKNTAAPPGVAGLNACAIGYPPNTTLQTIMPNNLFIIKNGAGSIDYITAVSTNPADCRVIVEDLIG